MITTITWVKQPDIYEAGAVGGDWQVSDGWNVRYLPDVQPVDGQFALVDENIYVESKADDGSGPYVVTVQTIYLVCKDLEDPGGTELWGDIDYGDYDVNLYDELERAVAATRRLADTTTGALIGWDGRPPWQQETS